MKTLAQIYRLGHLDSLSRFAKSSSNKVSATFISRVLNPTKEMKLKIEETLGCLQSVLVSSLFLHPTHFSDLLIKFTLKSSMCFVFLIQTEHHEAGKVLNKLQFFIVCRRKEKKSRASF